MVRNFGTGNRKTRYVLRLLEREKVALDFFRFFLISEKQEKNEKIIIDRCSDSSLT